MGRRPRVGWAPLRFVEPEDLGAPLYEHRSRMSDGTRIIGTEAAHEACVRLVASEGGVAGMGETLRRIPWQRARMELDRMITDTTRIDCFPKVEKDEWPAH